MDISIHAKLQRFIQEELAAGHYESIDELVNTAIARLRHERQFPPEADEDLKREVALGVEQLDRGEAEEWDPEGLWEEVERRHAEETRPDGKKAG